MDIDEAYKRRDELVFLDVREPHEWRAGHIDGALHIPMGQLAARQAELPTDNSIACVCRSGSRSASVTNALKGAGYDAENVEGGMLAWDAAGYEVVGP